MRKVVVLLAAIMLLCLGVLAQATVFDLGPGLTNLETVPVGDVENAADTEVMNDGTTGYGSVGYTYNIGKYEVTAGQYCDFLNHVADTDTYGLYNASMWSDTYGCRIQRSGSSGSYTYSVVPDRANRPVDHVSFWDACRFANWLHNGQPTGSQNLSTTEDGAYFINGYNGTDGRTIQRKAGCRWAVTSENEWYKGAYYKGHGTTAGYWGYPTSSDAAPGQDMNDASGNNANYYTAPFIYPIDNGKYTTVVGEFQNSASPYGTFDQGGNVYEWNEAVPRPGYDVASRGIRGGFFYDHDAGYLRASSRGLSYPTAEANGLGFRVSAVPEPSSLVLLGSGILALAGTMRRRR